MITWPLWVLLIAGVALLSFGLGIHYNEELNRKIPPFDRPEVKETNIRYDKGLCMHGNVILRQSTYIVDNEDNSRDMITINHN